MSDIPRWSPTGNGNEMEIDREGEWVVYADYKENIEYLIKELDKAQSKAKREANVIEHLQELLSAAKEELSQR